MEAAKGMVVVTGATGRTGRLIVEELVKRGYRVRAVVRSASAASGLKREGVELIEGDIASVDSLAHIMEGAQFVISALGSKKPFNARENNMVDNLGNQNVARAAGAQSIKHLVLVSSIGVGDSSRALSFIWRLLMSPVLKVKTLSEDFIRACGVSYTIIRPGGLKDTEISGRIAFGEGGKIAGAISRRDVARVCVDALSKPSMKNRTFEVVDAARVKDELRSFLITLE